VHYDPLGVVAAIVSWNYRKLWFEAVQLINLMSLAICSSPQRLVTYHGRFVFWQCDRTQVLRERRMVDRLVYQRVQKVSACLWSLRRPDPGDNCVCWNAALAYFNDPISWSAVTLKKPLR
jgi:hypothetical protein